LDERGLFLLITPAGDKWWEFRSKFDGKEKLLSLAVYPDIPLASRTLKEEETGKARKIKGALELRDFVFPGARSNERPMSDNAILAQCGAWG
jgi:hypothetical protein